MLCAGLRQHLYESLKALCCLANADGPLQAHEVATAAELPPAQTAKILQLMAWAGFVESRRGTKGGFWLITPANKIRVTDVADFFAHHTKGQGPRKHNGLLKGLERATARCQKEFARITVADLAKLGGCKPMGQTSAGRNSTTRVRRSAPTKGATRIHPAGASMN